VFAGSMSIIGVRPEVPHYVECYTPEDYATLLMKPGLTSPVAIKYRHENALLSGSENPEKQYVEEILPAKMKLNCDYVKNFSFANDMKILANTLICFLYKDELLEKKIKNDN
jgi:lipopolysaccharide/colanic/teichoic acid biosynthesis glycosyltransferase